MTAAVQAHPQGPSRRIETARLVLRCHRPDDALALARLLDNWNVVRWLADVPFPYGHDDAAAWIAQATRRWSEGGEYQFVMARAEDERLIGHIGLRGDPGGEVAEFGYWLGQAYWGAGYAVEAGAAILAFGFEELDLRRILATCLPDNARSLAVLRRLGFRTIGQRRQHFVTRGHSCEAPLLAVERPRIGGDCE